MGNIDTRASAKGHAIWGSSKGAFKQGLSDKEYESIPINSTKFKGTVIQINALYSNPIYGNSTTVQPPAIQLIPQIRY